jgi:hypothetical protein
MIKSIIQLFQKNERYLVVLIIVILISLSILPSVVQYIRTPKDAVFSFFHNSISDYPYYISFLRQGINGRLTTLDQFTSEPQTTGFVHVFYLILGFCGRLFFSSPVSIYLVSRIILGAVFLISGYALIRYFISDKNFRMLSFFLFSFSTSFPNVSINNKVLSLSQFLPWWTEVDPIKRATFIPHFLFGHISLVLCILFLVKVMGTNKLKYLIFAILMGFFTGFVHPPSLGMVYYIFGIFFFIKTIYFLALRYILKKSTPFYISEIMYFIIFIFFTVPSLVYIYFSTMNIFPWTLMKAQESLFYFIDVFEYLLSIGPVLILGIMGILILYKLNIDKNKKVFSPLLILWVMIDIVMVPLSKIIVFSHLPFKIPTFANIRFLSMAIQLPLAILSGYFFMFINRKFGKKYLIAILIIVALFTFSLYPQSIIGQLNDFSSAKNFLYLTKSEVSAFKYLDAKDAGRAVLARHDLSLLLPLYARNIVYAGQAVYTYDNKNKMVFVDRFYSGKMTEKEAVDLLKNGNIGYVLADGENEIKVSEKYKFLKAEYTTPGNTKVFGFSP